MSDNKERWEELGFSSKEEYDRVSPDTKASLNKAFLKAQQKNSWPSTIENIAIVAIVIAGLAYCEGPRADKGIAGHNVDQTKITQPKALPHSGPGAAKP